MKTSGAMPIRLAGKVSGEIVKLPVLGTLKTMQTHRDNIENRADRWGILAGFADRFLRPFRANDQIPNVAVEASTGMLPAALVEFYMLCGRADDIWCRQDCWLKPKELQTTQDVLVFWVENQAVWRLAI